MSKNVTRDRIVDAANQLFYQQGFEYTSFSQIAQVVKISRGNFYHHFKTKDEILDAVINLRLSNASAMLERWEVEGESPTDRIRSFINILITNQSNIKRYGCPIGTLCNEMAKLDHPAKDDANKLLTLFRAWIRKQFEQLSCHDDADELAMHVLARSQGVATLASAFNDEKFINQEVTRFNEWLTSCTTTENA